MAYAHYYNAAAKYIYLFTFSLLYIIKEKTYFEFRLSWDLTEILIQKKNKKAKLCIVVAIQVKGK